MYVYINIYVCVYKYIYIYVYIYVCIYKYICSITDMCCCQITAAVAHLLPVLSSSCLCFCLCFVPPNQGPDSGPKNGATILKLVAQLPNLWPQVWAHGICVLRVELRQVAFFIHVFLRVLPGCWFHTIYIYIYICF